MTAQIHVLSDPDTLAVAVADWLVGRMRGTSKPFSMNLSGGSTPKRLYGLLAQAPYRDQIEWQRLHLFFGDERYVPHDDPESNYRMVHDALIAHVPLPAENVHPIPAGPSPAEAAAAYEAKLKNFYGADHLDPSRPLFDVSLLGLGPDGHTASLFPGSSALEEKQAWVLSVIGSKPPPQRITLTLPVLDSCAAAAFIVSGSEKEPIVQRLLGGDKALPAGRISPLGELHWFLDEAAAGGPAGP
ncbi:6-phosphogluconolactonase [Rhodoligotrophos defluvii]|uniref:6-phosphogluconolactonase n=1 Tax=Rhodoligotrophos defluvii TaxID=2561934 RepID=UPI0010CA1674|nr:6-phosphogluconolactonase [Rhodoligotrophos defluvii]